jgi:CubicO group peptidase (beta-lactamase class C family)
LSVLEVGGRCDPRFGAVRDAFAANFTERGETGAAVCLAVHGTVVADLWAGQAGPPPGRAWQPDTLVNVFSVGKGLIAACVARLIGRSTPTRRWPGTGRSSLPPARRT